MSLRSELMEAVGRIPSGGFDTEEAAKLSLVLPLLSELGYDTVGHSNIIPEYAVGHCRVDLALLSNGLPSVLVECKRRNSFGGARQLHGYMDASGVGVGILTDGIVWEFFKDSGDPFFVFDIRSSTEGAIRAFAGFSAGRDIAEAVTEATGVSGLVAGLDGSAGYRTYIEEAIVAAVRSVVARAGGDPSAVRAEGYRSDTNVFFWPDTRNTRRRLLQLNFRKRRVYLRVYGAGSNYDKVAQVRLRVISDIADYVTEILAVAFRGGEHE